MSMSDISNLRYSSRLAVFGNALSAPNQTELKMSNAKLYVGNISFQTTENDLEDLFSPIGPVTEVNLIVDRATQRPRGFAFVTMQSEADAAKAVDQLNGQTVGGRKITVNAARPPEDRPRRFDHSRSHSHDGGERRDGGSRRFNR